MNFIVFVFAIAALVLGIWWTELLSLNLLGLSSGLRTSTLLIDLCFFVSVEIRRSIGHAWLIDFDFKYFAGSSYLFYPD